jgi:hypothetical protein
MARRSLTQEERDHLFSVYSVERQDDQSALVTAFAITTAGITYVVVAAAYLNDHCGSSGCHKTAAWTPLLAPVIPVALFGFLVLNVAATRMRSGYLQRLEEVLMIRLPAGGSAPAFHTDAGLVFRPGTNSDLIYKPGTPRKKYRVRHLFAAVTFISYALVALVLIGFTWTAIVPGPWPWPWWKFTIAAVYVLMEAVEIAGLVVPLRHRKFAC